MPDPKGGVKLTAKALKVTVVLDAAALGQIELPQGKAAPPLVIAVDGREVRAQIPAKCLRKVLGLIAEHGADKMAVILQGKLAAGTVIAKAGLVAQVKVPKRQFPGMPARRAPRSDRSYGSPLLNFHYKLEPLSPFFG